METSTKLHSYRRLLLVSGLGWLFDAMDVGLVSFIIADLVKSWHLTSEQAGWLGSINSIGMAIGAAVAGILADRIGRRQVFTLTLLLFSIVSGLSALATTYYGFAIFRFFIGIGLGGELPVASTLVSETVPAEKRGRVVVLLESFWAVGWILSAIIAYIIIPNYGWRVAVLLAAIPALYIFYLRKNLPESTQLTGPKEGNLSILETISSLWGPHHARQTALLWILWFTVSFSYYGIFLWLPTVMVTKGFGLIKSFQYVLIMTLAQLPGYFSAAWLIEKIGRKFVLVVYLTATAISSYFFGSAASLPTLMIAGILMSFFNLGAWGALYAYTPEQYPFQFRTTGAGMAAAVGRIGSILGPLMIGYMAAANTSYSIIFGLFFVITLIGALTVLVLGKETRSRELT